LQYTGLGNRECQMGNVIRVLDADPDLGAALPPEVFAVAARHALAEVKEIPPGAWVPSSCYEAGHPLVGVLIIDGLLTRDMQFAGRMSSELMGAGDLLRPWDQDASFDPIPLDVTWQVLEKAHIAILDRHFAAVIGKWPVLVDAVTGRAVKRSRALAFQLAISQVTRVDERLLVLMWHLAERWGRVGPDGVRVPLRLTHEALGRLVGARRPSVTTALTGLAKRGCVERTPTGWLLRGDPAEQLAELLHDNAAESTAA
jgi:CRP/FNR family transcriptional regulator, cyclic AMP receptor protein